jgi:hypothetical protein
MLRHRMAAFAMFVLFASPAAARAHFLFIRIGEPAEAGRSVEVFFSEKAAAGDPRFTEKIAGCKLTLQASPGKFEPLAVSKGTDRLRAALPAAGSVSVTGVLEYGLLKREVPFLLRHYPKAIAGDPHELATMGPRPGIPLEIAASIQDDQISFTLLRDGKPVPRAAFTTVDDDLVNEDLKSDAAGNAVWKPPAAGFYCVYAQSVLKTPGERNGKAYVEIREFATLAFRWPLKRNGPDPEAVALFQKALAARAAWTDFRGFSADLSGEVDGRKYSGKATVTARGDATLEMDEEVVKPWVEDQIHSIIMHRLAAPKGGSKEETKPPVLRFADQDTAHPLGRLLTFDGGEFASSYRVRDDRITVVNRVMGGRNMTITVLDESRNADGKQLPRTYTVQYWNAQDGTLDRTESFSLRWTRVDRWDLPASVTMTAASKSGLSVRTIRLTKHRIAKTQ